MYNCKCKPQCIDFRTHVLGFSFSMKPAYQVGNRVAVDIEKRWQKEADSYDRLAKEGYQGDLANAPEIEARATTQLELDHGRLYENPTLVEAVNEEMTIT